MTDSKVFDVRFLTAGKIVEYANSKGSKRVVLINKRLGSYLEVTNEVNKVFTIPVKRVSYLIEGDFRFEDLKLINEMVLDLKPVYVEKIYDNLVSKKPQHPSSPSASSSSPLERDDNSSKKTTVAYTLEYISNLLYPTSISSTNQSSSREGDSSNESRYDADGGGGMKHVDTSSATESQRLYTAFRLMSMYGDVFFEIKDTDKLQEGSLVHGLGMVAIAAAAANKNVINVYVPLEKEQVNMNMKDAAALREFRARYKKLIELSAVGPSGGSRGEGGGPKSSSRSLASAGIIMPEMPERVAQVLSSYGPGLKQIAIERHPWVNNGWARIQVNQTEADKGRKLLDLLGLAPSAKNARKVLEVGGIWKPHVNVEKYVMQIRDEFPPAVMAEAVHLVENADSIVDMDERIRRDLRHLGAYAIDREGAAEVDDAVSVEFLEDGREKLWIHIADVSHWVRPGSRLSLEAERRMTSIYMPDERISMFPEVLTTELLSLGSRVDSYALSCGVILTDEGEVESYEVCPSRVRVSRRLSYATLDEILAEERLANSADAGSDASTGATASGADGNTAAPAGGEKTKGSTTNAIIRRDLTRLQHWAMLRNRKRISDGSLDDMLRHKTELFLVVRERDVGTGGKVTSHRDHQQQQLVTASASMGAGARNSHRHQNSSSSSSSTGASAGNTDVHRWGVGPAGKLQPSPTAAPARTKVVVNGYMSWSNASSVSLVSEYMVLMCQVMGSMCKANEIPVWFKVQKPNPPLQPADLRLRADENLVLRSARIISHLRSANDSKVPGEHATTGSNEYVQCTSPIRRYHDLYNHYRLKAAMHAASLGADYEDRAKEEAGITMLDQMATAEERLQTLIACRRVVRNREQYWLRSYVEKLCSTRPRLSFDCMVVRGRGVYSDDLWREATFAGQNQNGPASVGAAGESEGRQEDEDEDREGSAPDNVSSAGASSLDASGGGAVSAEGYISEVLILQLGTFRPHLLYHRQPLRKGELVKCHIFKQYSNPVSHVLLAAQESVAEAPSFVVDQLLSHKERSVAALLKT